MPITVIIHVQGGDAMVGEIEDMPDPRANYITVTNVRTRDGKSVVYIDRDATRVLFPWHRISFLETLPSEEDHEEFESFFRD
ncbi:MAG TPA: hypothetical protein PKE64_30260 [Anaerolineae bacterium]|nr:hypothetical protein [Anaerolineae bacterium]HMR68316.1 hypothetical protein [Anaerolineae bacterium]